MFRGRAVALLLLVGLLTPALAGCGKKPAPEEGAPAAARDRGEAPRARRDPPRDEARVEPARSAAEACAEGARPDHGVSKEQFEVIVKAPREAKVGEAVVAEIQVSPKTGYKMNLKYPTELSLKRGSDGLSFSRQSFDRTHAKELTLARLRYEASFTATSPGVKVVRGEIGFSVCTPKVCITEPDFCVAWEVTAR